MKTNIVAVVAALIFFAGVALCQAGSVEMGKLLFESPTFGGGTSGKSCKTCHAGGNNISSKLFSKETKTFSIMGMKKNSLADVVNVCIEKPLAGKAINPDGEQMANIIAYMETIAK
ncbi:MAG: hypothetical protein KAJ10_07860 [Thermodesulfovibrionia bacterium]|nr:hypothetical protein [Thermodesulfovibrionia bacterium]